jgi:hypothetical protein
MSNKQRPVTGLVFFFFEQLHSNTKQPKLITLYPSPNFTFS